MLNPAIGAFHVSSFLDHCCPWSAICSLQTVVEYETICQRRQVHPMVSTAGFQGAITVDALTELPLTSSEAAGPEA